MKKNVNPMLVLILLCVSFSLAQQREISSVKLGKISERLYEILGGRGARGGAYIGEGGVLVIDAKMNEQSVNETIQEIKKLTDKPIKYLVNTHSDGDHIRGNQYFPKTVTFIAHENCRKEFFHPSRDGTVSEWNKPELTTFVPSITFHDKMDIYLGTTKIELWYFGVGHTTGDAVVYFPEEKAAFLGDQIFLTRPQLIHSYKGGNSFEHVKTLTRMLEKIEAEQFYSGHSEMTDRKGIRNHIDQMKKWQEKVKALIEQGRTKEEIIGVFEENQARLIETIYGDIQK